MRAQCVFEDAATRCAIGLLSWNLSPEQMQTEKRMRSKMIEMSGDAPRDRGRERVPVTGPEGRGPNEVATRIQAATFTGKGDGEVVVSLYLEYYWKLSNAASRAQSYAGARDDVKDDCYSGPASELLIPMTRGGWLYWPCLPCVCCVLIGVKELGCCDFNRYADRRGELTWRGDDPDAGRAKLRSNGVALADVALPQAQEMRRDPPSADSEA